ncbi:MAG: hypothetical protein LIO74_10395 [Ruminococcus sp.]|nr:hypothetical protein [Ruminococcus sp.]
MMVMGLCWAASIGTRFNYFNSLAGHSTKLTAYYIYVRLKAQYGSEPSGTKDWILNGYDFLYSNFKTTQYYSGMMTYSEITTQLKNENPIHISLTNGAKFHSVILSGIKIYNGYALYYIDDPNSPTTAHISAYVSSDTMNAKSNFVYQMNSSSTKYMTWYRSFY